MERTRAEVAVAGRAARPPGGGAAGGVAPQLVGAATAGRVVRRPRDAAPRPPPLSRAGAAPQDARQPSVRWPRWWPAPAGSCSAAGCRRPRSSTATRPPATSCSASTRRGRARRGTGEVADEYRDDRRRARRRSGRPDRLEQRRDQQGAADRRLRSGARPAQRGEGGVRGLRRDPPVASSSSTSRRGRSSTTAPTGRRWSATGWCPASSGSTGSTRTAAGRWCWRPTESSVGAASSTSARPRTTPPMPAW